VDDAAQTRLEAMKIETSQDAVAQNSEATDRFRLQRVALADRAGSDRRESTDVDETAKVIVEHMSSKVSAVAVPGREP
jgi:hypothetical protein